MAQATGNIEDICEFAINYLLSRQGNAKSLVALLANQNPERRATELVFVLASAAASIEEVFASAEISQIALDGWRTAALVGVEVHIIQARGLPHHTCAELMAYWQTYDGYFLKPAAL